MLSQQEHNLLFFAGPQPGFFEGNGPVETSVRVTDEGLANKSSVGVIRALMLAVAVSDNIAVHDRLFPELPHTPHTSPDR